MHLGGSRKYFGTNEKFPRSERYFKIDPGYIYVLKYYQFGSHFENHGSHLENEKNRVG